MNDKYEQDLWRRDVDEMLDEHANSLREGREARLALEKRVRKLEHPPLVAEVAGDLTLQLELEGKVETTQSVDVELPPMEGGASTLSLSAGSSNPGELGTLEREEPKMASDRWKVIREKDEEGDTIIHVFLRGTFREGTLTERKAGVWHGWVRHEYGRMVPDVGYYFTDDEAIEAVKMEILALETSTPSPKDHGFDAGEQDDDIPF